MDVNSYTTIQKWSRDLAGVFTIPDLKVALAENAEVTLYRKLSKLLEAKVLVKVKRGIYATPDAALTTISSRIARPGPASAETTLKVVAARPNGLPLASRTVTVTRWSPTSAGVGVTVQRLSSA